MVAIKLEAMIKQKPINPKAHLVEVKIKKKKKKELKGRFARTRPAFETHHKIV